MRALVLATLLTVGCHDDWRDAYDFEWHGENVTVYGYGYTEADVCGGSLRELDEHSAMIASDLGVSFEPFVYRWTSPAFSEEIGDLCHGAAACARSDGATAAVLPLMHEALHMITWNLGDGCPRLLDEGMAMYYNHAVQPSGEDGTAATEDVRRLFDGGTWPSDKAVPESMHFAAFMAETYEPQAIASLCEALPREPSREQWAAAFRSVLDLSLEQVLAEYGHYPKCTYSQMRAKLWGCRRPHDLELRGEGERIVIESDCDDPQATNVGGGHSDASLRRLMHVPWDMIVEVDAYSPGDRQGPNATYVITECAPCSATPNVFADQRHPIVEDRHALRAGYHEITMFFDRRDRVRLDLKVIDVLDDQPR